MCSQTHVSFQLKLIEKIVKMILHLLVKTRMPSDQYFPSYKFLNFFFFIFGQNEFQRRSESELLRAEGHCHHHHHHHHHCNHLWANFYNFFFRSAKAAFTGSSHCLEMRANERMNQFHRFWGENWMILQIKVRGKLFDLEILVQKMSNIVV